MYIIIAELVLNADNVTRVLREAGIKDEHKPVVAKHLGLSESILSSFFAPLLQVVHRIARQEEDVWSKVLTNWSKQGSPVSWEKLAKAIENIPENGVKKSQTVRELSGAGTHTNH